MSSGKEAPLNLSYKNLLRLYYLKGVPEASPELLRETTKAIFTLSELTRLTEIRLEELENSPQAKDRPDIIDNREISVLIGDRWAESRRACRTAVRTGG